MEEAEQLRWAVFKEDRRLIQLRFKADLSLPGPNMAMTDSQTRAEAEARTSNSMTPRIHSKAREGTRSLRTAPEKHSSEEIMLSDSTDHPTMEAMGLLRTMKVGEAKQTTGVLSSSQMLMMEDARDSRGQRASNTDRQIPLPLEKAVAMERRLQRELKISQATSSTQVGKERIRTIKDSRMDRMPRARKLSSIKDRACLLARWVTLALMGRVPSIRLS